MWALLALLSIISAALGEIQTVEFTMNAEPPPEPGALFHISWAPECLVENTTILLNNLDGAKSSSRVVSNLTLFHTPEASRYFGSLTWRVPKDLCGRHSFSIYCGSETSPDAVGRSQIWDNGLCSHVATFDPSRLCKTRGALPNSDPNCFLVARGEGYFFRVGEKSLISWVPSDYDETIDLLLQKQGVDGPQEEPMIIAENIPNSGSYEWTPCSSLINQIQISSGVPSLEKVRLVQSSATYKFFIRGSSGVLTESPNAFLFKKSDPPFFKNLNSWAYPVVGQPVNILWSPHNESTITITLENDSGAILIADNISNTGSYTWQVPSDFAPGYYSLRGLTHPAPGFGASRLYSVIVGKEPRLDCEQNAYMSSFLSVDATSQAGGAKDTSLKGDKQSDRTGAASMTWLGIARVAVSHLLKAVIVQ